MTFRDRNDLRGLAWSSRTRCGICRLRYPSLHGGSRWECTSPELTGISEEASNDSNDGSNYPGLVEEQRLHGATTAVANSEDSSYASFLDGPVVWLWYRNRDRGSWQGCGSGRKCASPELSGTLAMEPATTAMMAANTLASLESRCQTEQRLSTPIVKTAAT